MFERETIYWHPVLSDNKKMPEHILLKQKIFDNMPAACKRFWYDKNGQWNAILSLSVKKYYQFVNK